MACSGRADDLTWLRGEVEKKFEIKTQVLGQGKGQSPTVKVLNRTVHLPKDGTDIEADEKHAETIIKEMGLDSSSKSVATPVDGHTDDELRQRSEPLKLQDATM